MKKIGVLGGLGPYATMDFEARIHRVTLRLVPQNRNEGYPPLRVHYFRHLPVVLPGSGDDAAPPVPHPPIYPLLLDAAEHLGAWVDFLVIVSNGMHAYQHEIEKHCRSSRAGEAFYSVPCLLPIVNNWLRRWFNFPRPGNVPSFVLFAVVRA